MTRELLLQIIHQNLLLQVISVTFIMISYFAYWFILIGLSLQILKIKINIKKLVLPVFIMFLFSFAAKPFLPTSTHGPIMVVLFILLLTAIIERFNAINILKSAWAVILITMISGIGSVFIVNTLCFINHDISKFFMYTIFGNIVGSLTEAFFPFVALLILRKYPKIVLIPPIEKLKKIDIYDIVGILTFGAMFYTIYSTSINLYLDLGNNPRQQVFSEFIAQWVAAIGTICGSLLLFKNLKKSMNMNGSKPNMNDSAGKK